MNKSEIPQFFIKVLGSGTCIPSATRYPSSYFIQPAHSPRGWLVDLGSGALQRLAQAGESYLYLDHIFLSHVHPDHIMSLLPLFQALNNTPGYHRTEPLLVYGPQTVKEYIETNLNFAPSWHPSFPFEFVLLEKDSLFSCNGCHVAVRALQHSAITLGYRFQLEDCTLVYGADTEPCEALIELAAEADLLIAEASYPRAHPSRGHMTTFQAGEVAKQANVKRLLLTHFYPVVDMMSTQEKEEEVRASGYTGEILFATDLMELSVSSRHINNFSRTNI
jgi:ribonuclease BN (tRNA processing enzyme)